ncbi:MAG: hypothetical protein ACRDFB_06440 [Rhabdochlamydiaceae bacterium]
MSSNPIQYNQQVFTVTPGGPDQSFGLDWVPVWLQISNPSSYYLSFPNAVSIQPIPPYTQNAVVAWGQGAGSLVFSTAHTPAGAPTLPTSAASITITATQNPNLTTSAGTSTYVATSANITGPVTISGTVSLTPGTAVEIDGSPTVDIASGATIGINGTPTVELEAGSEIEITGTPNITIVGGQGGETNVSIDAPPLPGPILSAVATNAGLSTTVYAPANTTAISVSVEDFAASSQTISYTITLLDVLTASNLALVTGKVVGGTAYGTIVTAALPIGAITYGIVITIELYNGTFTVTGEVARVGYYLGNTVTGVLNTPEQPLYVTPGSQGSIGSATPSLATLIGANNVSNELSPLSIETFGRLLIAGMSGSSGQDVVVTPDAPQHCADVGYILSSIETSTIITGITGISIHLRKACLFIQGIGSGTFYLQSTGNNKVFQYNAPNASVFTVSPIDWEGYTLPIGEGLEITIVNAITSGMVTGTLTYDQY